ncbi:MAG TPA: ABC transporter ATP-binding protein [Clostridia bacterium]|jgi:putative ABC transport system ATP-binding protein|nr:ABC transporter ATP-binding protein [Clostridia bacterium]
MLKIDNLHLTFNPQSVNEKKALRGVSLELAEGDFVTIVGSNGAGKSTLLNSVAGIYQPDRGCIVLNGKNITRMPVHRRASFIGRVFQDPKQGTAASMTIEENMALALRRGKRRGVSRGITKKDRDLFREQLAILGLGLEDRLTTKVGLLSGGQRQALTLLMANLIKPKLLLLDEHTAALDPKTSEQILDLTERLITEGKITTLMVTHNLEQALKYGNRMVMMHEGEIILHVSGKEKEEMTVNKLLLKFEEVRGTAFSCDRAMLA